MSMLDNAVLCLWLTNVAMPSVEVMHASSLCSMHLHSWCFDSANTQCATPQSLHEALSTSG